MDEMKRRIPVIIAAILLTVLTASVANGLFFANLFVVTGTITLQGQPAQKDLTVAAFIGEEKIVESKTKEGGSFELRIPEYDPAKPEISGYRSPDDVIVVKLDGRKAKPSFSPTQDQLKIDLRVETSLDVKLSTWGKIKALFK